MDYACYLESPGLNLSSEHPIIAEDFREFYESCRENGWIVPEILPSLVFFTLKFLNSYELCQVSHRYTNKC